MRWPITLFLFGGLLMMLAEAKRRVVGFVLGQPTPLELTSIGGGHYLETSAATAFIAMRAAAASTGVGLSVNSSFRDLTTQQSLWDAMQRGERDDVVAQPGWSKHQSGRAVDVGTGRGTNAAFFWLTANASRFGFKRTVASEPWHWEYTA